MIFFRLFFHIYQLFSLEFLLRIPLSAKIIILTVFPVSFDEGAEICLAHVYGFHDLDLCIVVS